MTSLLSVVLLCGIDDKDTLIAELYGHATTGILEREEPGGECTLEAFFDTPQQAAAAMDEFASFHPFLVHHRARDYVQEFQDHWQPVAIGRRLWLAPPWHPGPPPAHRFRIDYQPGMACGSGAHPCTRLCLEALDQTITPAAAVADVGVGSGILLLAAKALGAARIAGCDIDHDSVRIAHQAVPQAVLFTGSAAALASARFDVVIANISSQAVDLLLPDLRRIAAPSGHLILSGFRVEQMPPGLANAGIRQLDGWACLVFSQY